MAYVIVDCVVNYIRAIESVTLLRLLTNNVSKRQYVGGCLGLGMLIWNCVLLFRDIGVDRISENPYYMYIFISFLVNMIILGIAVCMLVITICCLGCFICFDQDSKMPEIQIHVPTLTIRQSASTTPTTVSIVPTSEDPLPPV